MMTFIKGLLIVLCTCLGHMSLHAQDDSVSRKSVKELKGTSCIPIKDISKAGLAFQGGEKMQFTMHYSWGMVNTDVGSATVTLEEQVYDGQKVFCCVVKGQTTRLFDMFFKVREDFRSWFTVDSLRPLKFTRDTREGKYEARNTYIYNWNAAEPYIQADVYSSSQGQRYPEIPLTPCTFDLPSLFFFARNIDLDMVEKGRRYPMTFAIDDEVYNVHFVFYGKEVKDIKGLGKVRTIRFSAKLLAGEVFTGEEDMMIWISDDENRVPVYFEAPILVGTAMGRLVSAEGLKYPFEIGVK